VAEVALNERILTILRDVAGTAQVTRDLDVPLYTSGLLDSLATVSLMAAFAEDLGVNVSPAEFDAANWATPRLLIADITRRALVGEAG